MKGKWMTWLLLLFAVPGFAQEGQHPDILAYIGRYKDMAMQEMKRTGIPAAIKLAQGIHETQAGKSDLVLRSNNHFGIKCKTNWAGGKVYHDDDARGECFRSYGSAEESYRDHSDFLRNNQRYSSLFQLKPLDYAGWANGLKKAGYATNPRYPTILIKTIEDYNLQLYTEVALGLAREPDVILVKNEPLEMPVPPAPTVSKPNAPVVQKTVLTSSPKKQWPSGIFTINGTKVLYAKAGTSMLSLAQEHRIQLGRLMEFNEMKEVDVLTEDQLVYLQRKRRTGEEELHLVVPGETTAQIAREKGIRLEALLAYNGLSDHQQPKAGEKLYLQKKNPGKVALETGVVRSQLNTANTVSGNTVYHTVQQKETLYSISRRYMVSVNDLRLWNNLSGEGLKIGQQLLIQKTAYEQDAGTR